MCIPPAEEPTPTMFSRFTARCLVLLALVAAAGCATQRPMPSIYDLRDTMPERAFRFSSSDETNWEHGNGDNRPIAPGQTLTLAEIEGPGIIKHIWFTFVSDHPHGASSLVLRMYWDGEGQPSVEVPLGDFFAVGHGLHRDVDSAMVAVSAEGRSYNCYWPMPFRESARITVTNESTDWACTGFFYMVDGGYTAEWPANTPYFHAKYRQERPAGEGDYLVWEGRGAGYYVGTVYSVVQSHPGWFGEGDDRWWIDDDVEPTLLGTGTEDYFNDAWGFRLVSRPYYGINVWEGMVYGGRVSAYRWHVPDPIPFSQRARFVIEHKGTFWDFEKNEIAHPYRERPDYLSSVAFWYQTGQELHFADFPAQADRVYPFYRIEAESLVEAIQERTPDAIVRPQESPLWSGNTQVVVVPESSAYALVVPFDVPSTSKFRIECGLTRSFDFGQFEVYLNGEFLQKVDLYADPTELKEYNFGVHKLPAGTSELEFRCVGANPGSMMMSGDSPGYLMGIDVVTLEDVGDLGPEF